MYTESVKKSYIIKRTRKKSVKSVKIGKREQRLHKIMDINGHEVQGEGVSTVRHRGDGN